MMAIAVIGILALMPRRGSHAVVGFGDGREGTMTKRRDACLTGVLFRLAAGALLGLGSANQAWPQAPAPSPQPPRAAQPAGPPNPASVAVFQVFPDGGLPTSPPAPEGGIPAPPAKPGPGTLPPPPKSPTADYAPPGVFPPDYLAAPGAVRYRPFTDPGQGQGEVYTPSLLPSPEYFVPAV